MKPHRILGLVSAGLFLSTSWIAAENQTADPVASLRLSIDTDRDSYVLHEPARIFVTMENDGASPIVLRYQVRKSPYRVVFEVKNAEGRFSSRPWSPSFVGCGQTRPDEETSKSFPPGRTRITRYYVPRAPVGEVVVSAILEFLVGPHAGRQFVSNEIRFEIAEPEGADLAMLESRDLWGGIICGESSMSASSWRLEQGSPAHLGRRGHECMRQFYGTSIYSHHARFQMSRYLQKHEQGLRQELLEEIVREAPPRFPLLADAHASLLETYRDRGEFERMHEVAQSYRKNPVKTVDPYVETRLAELLDEVAWWPPSDAISRAKSAWGEKRVRARHEFFDHWIVRGLEEAHGLPVYTTPCSSHRDEPCSMGHIRLTGRVWATKVEVHYWKHEKPAFLRVSGPLISFCVEELKDVFCDLGIATHPGDPEARNFHIEGQIRGDTISGTLWDRDGGSVSFEQTIRTRPPFEVAPN